MRPIAIDALTVDELKNLKREIDREIREKKRLLEPKTENARLGTSLTPYRTIAVDPSVIPLGSHVIINGHEYIAEDAGGAIKGRRIDLCVETHSEAMSKGVIYADVYLVK